MGQFGMEEALGAHPVTPLLKEGSFPAQGVVWSDKFTPVCYLPHIKISYKAVEVSLKMLVWFFPRPQEINKEELEGNSMRCGRKLAKDGDVSVACGKLQSWHG